MFLAPELVTCLQDHALDKVQAAIVDYEQIALYWFVAFAEAGPGENALNPLYNAQSLFRAKA